MSSQRETLMMFLGLFGETGEGNVFEGNDHSLTRCGTERVDQELPSPPPLPASSLVPTSSDLSTSHGWQAGHFEMMWLVLM